MERAGADIYLINFHIEFHRRRAAAHDKINSSIAGPNSKPGKILVGWVEKHERVWFDETCTNGVH